MQILTTVCRNIDGLLISRSVRLIIFFLNRLRSWKDCSSVVLEASSTISRRIIKSFEIVTLNVLCTDCAKVICALKLQKLINFKLCIVWHLFSDHFTLLIYVAPRYFALALVDDIGRSRSKDQDRIFEFVLTHMTQMHI